MTIVFAIAFIVVCMVAYLALRNAQDFSDANEVVPGVDTGAPKEWAGAHSPEARLHRRLRDSMTALRDNAALDDPSLSSVRTGLEEQAVAVDRRLVAVAALPRAHRDEPLAQVAQAVEAVEAAVAGFVTLRGPSTDDIERAIADIRTRVGLVEEARAELEALTAPSPDLDALRRRLESQESPAEQSPAEGDEGTQPST